MDTSVKLYSLSFRQTKTYLVAAALIAGNIVLPAVCHLIPQGGLIFLPIYFFTLFGACKYGIKAGLLIGILSPLINHLLTGMPPAPMLPAILIKSCLIVFASVFAVRKFGKLTIPVLIGIVLGYQIVGGLFEWLLTGSLFAVLQNFRLALPGMLLQVLGVYGLVKLMAKFGY
ncbi:MAG: ECF transporter S component [Rikenellaceae bacterium]|nr:ECF transporter S component [Rikenellaceae bacterium]